MDSLRVNIKYFSFCKESVKSILIKLRLGLSGKTRNQALSSFYDEIIKLTMPFHMKYLIWIATESKNCWIVINENELNLKNRFRHFQNRKRDRFMWECVVFQFRTDWITDNGNQRQDFIIEVSLRHDSLTAEFFEGENEWVKWIRLELHRRITQLLSSHQHR